MPIKHAFNILFSRYSVTFKMTGYFLLVLLLLAIIATCVIQPLLAPLVNDLGNISKDALSAITSLFRGEDPSTVLTNLGLAWDEMATIFYANKANLVQCIIILGVLLICAVYIVNLSTLTCSDIINNFMNSNSRFGFVSNFLANLGRSAVYSALYLVTILPFNILMYAGVIGIIYAFFTLRLVGLGLILAFWAWLLLVTIRGLLFGGWVPAIVADDVSPIKAISMGFVAIRKVKWNAMMSYLMSHFLAYLLVAFCSIVTFGAGAVLALPAGIMICKVTELVLYYSSKEYRFYVSDETVISKPVVTK